MSRSASGTQHVQVVTWHSERYHLGTTIFVGAKSTVLCRLPASLKGRPFPYANTSANRSHIPPEDLLLLMRRS